MMFPIERYALVAAAAIAFIGTSIAAADADCSSRKQYGAGIVFVTDREPLGDDRIFGGERARGDADDLITTGTLTAPKPAQTRGCTSRSSFFQALNRRFAPGRGPHILVYVHGRSTSFVTAARDALTLAHGVRFHGPVVLYSWPATVTAKPAYDTESRNAAWSAPHFAAFVNDLEAHYHNIPISFVASDVGARFATTGLRIVRAPRCHNCFERAVFVQPEIAADVLRRNLDRARMCDGRRDPARITAPITIYTTAPHSSSCSGIDTVRVPMRLLAEDGGRDPLANAILVHDVREALAGIPRSASSRRLAHTAPRGRKAMAKS
jgi:esterase/lipase superfamily enzyme